jgi:hypothetical protein
MIRDEILLELERKNQKFLYLILLVYILLSCIFLFFAGRFDTNPFKLKKEIKDTIELKLSFNDLASLGRGEDFDRWINVRLIESGRTVSRVKLKHAAAYSFDFQLNIEGTIYDLIRLGPDGVNIHEFFLTASSWGLERSSPRLAQLKINNVPAGIYMMEAHIHEQIRDARGGYFIRLGSDIRLLKKIFHQVGAGRNDKLKKYFDTSKLASYLVFFSLSSSGEVLDFQRLVFRFDPEKKKFLPYLTMESIVSSLKEQGKEFLPATDEDARLFGGLNRANIANLLSRAYKYKYRGLISAVLVEARSMMAANGR